MRTASTASFASTSSSTLNQALEFHLTPVEREQFNYYAKKEGILEKLSSAFLVGWQKRYWKIKCNESFLLCYYKQDKIQGEPQGILQIHKMKEINKESDRK
jgi:hypothetical protein